MTDRTDESVAHMGPSGDEPQSAGAREVSGPRLARSSMASPSSAVDEGETDTPVSDGPTGDVPDVNDRADSRDVDDEDADLGDDTGHREAGHGDAAGQMSARSHVNTHNVSLPSTSSTSGAARGAVSYAVGPFSVREVSLLGIWAVAFLVSFFPDNNVTGAARLLVGGSNVWLSGLWWIPAVALPTLAVGLLVLRRLSPQGNPPCRLPRDRPVRVRRLLRGGVGVGGVALGDGVDRDRHRRMGSFLGRVGRGGADGRRCRADRRRSVPSSLRR
ncbi:hypothetical protein [Microbacterium testaceum]|uniref:hypothetical protein n=1 Tax=Microbacterium testaceum TaxID=2033 RepID=UPI0027D7B446|nr:hypothetical protein [Microbacterium testaceum]